MEKHHIPHYHNDGSHPENTSISIYWLGVSTPSEKYESVGIIVPKVWKNKIHVPNQQPV